MVTWCVLMLLTFTSRSLAKTCQMGSTYFDRDQNSCVDCGEYPNGCNAFDNVTLANCLTNCRRTEDDEQHSPEDDEHDSPTNHNETNNYKIKHETKLTEVEDDHQTHRGNLTDHNESKYKIKHQTETSNRKPNPLIGVVIFLALVVVFLSVLIVAVFRKYRRAIRKMKDNGENRPRQHDEDEEASYETVL